MKVQEMKNYGRSYAETMVNLPQPVQKLIKKASSARGGDCCDFRFEKIRG
jgi:hypothetical protein